MIKWWHSPETFWFFLQVNLILLPAFHFPYALFLFISALSLFASARKTIAPLLQGARRWRNATLDLYSFLGCFHFSDSFLTSRVAGFHACASHLAINVFLRIPTATQKQWSFWSHQLSPARQILPDCMVQTDGMGLWPVWTWWSYRVPAAERNSHASLSSLCSSRAPVSLTAPSSQKRVSEAMPQQLSRELGSKIQAWALNKNC